MIDRGNFYEEENRVMKRLFTGILLALSLLLLPSTEVFADSENTYYLEEIGLHISLPDDLVTFTRDINESDPNLSTYGWDKDSLYSFFLSRSIYLNAWDNKQTCEVLVTMMDSPYKSLEGLDEEELLRDFDEYMPEEYEAIGIEYIKSEIYQTEQAKFIKIYVEQKNPLDGSTVYGIEYSTIYNNEGINITFHSYDGPINASNEAYIQDIVDTAIFDAIDLSDEPTPAISNSFQYTDTLSSITFTVPENWVETPLPIDSEAVTAKFAPSTSEDVFMMYGSSDLWETLTDSEKEGHHRADVNQYFFTKAELAEMFDVSAVAIESVKYNNLLYYKIRKEELSTTIAGAAPITLTILVRIDYGIMYLFYFNQNDSHLYHDDFEAFMKSVQYPSIVDIKDEIAPKAENIISVDTVISCAVFGFIAVVTLSVLLLVKKLFIR